MSSEKPWPGRVEVVRVTGTRRSDTEVVGGLAATPEPTRGEYVINVVAQHGPLPRMRVVLGTTVTIHEAIQGQPKTKRKISLSRNRNRRRYRCGR